MDSRPASGLRLDTLRAKLPQVEFVDKHIDDSHWVVLSDVVIENFRKQRALRPSFALDESFHHHLEPTTPTSIFNRVFSHTLGRKQRYLLDS